MLLDCNSKGQWQAQAASIGGQPLQTPTLDGVGGRTFCLSFSEVLALANDVREPRGLEIDTRTLQGPHLLRRVLSSLCTPKLRINKRCGGVASIADDGM